MSNMTREQQVQAIRQVLEDGRRHGISDFPGHYRRRWSILCQLVREGLAVKHDGRLGEDAYVWTAA